MSNTAAIASKSSFYQNIVLDVLMKMNRGRMYLMLPTGELVTIGDGDGVTATITINDKEFYKRIMLYGDIGFGEAYVDGLWDTGNITHVINWVLLNIEKAPGLSGSKIQT